VSLGVNFLGPCPRKVLEASVIGAVSSPSLNMYDTIFVTDVKYRININCISFTTEIHAQVTSSSPSSAAVLVCTFHRMIKCHGAQACGKNGNYDFQASLVQSIVTCSSVQSTCRYRSPSQVTLN
jgi:hypothetical protein